MRWRLSDHVVLESSEESDRHVRWKEVRETSYLPVTYLFSRRFHGVARICTYGWLTATLFTLILMWAAADRSGQIVPLSTTYFSSSLTHARTSLSGQLPDSSDLIYGHYEQHRRKTTKCCIVSNNSHMPSSCFWWAFTFCRLFLLRRLETFRCRSRLP